MQTMKCSVLWCLHIDCWCVAHLFQVVVSGLCAETATSGCCVGVGVGGGGGGGRGLGGCGGGGEGGGSGGAAVVLLLLWLLLYKGINELQAAEFVRIVSEPAVNLSTPIVYTPRKHPAKSQWKASHSESICSQDARRWAAPCQCRPLRRPRCCHTSQN